MTERPSHALRPGVTFPDWSEVTSSAALVALTAILSSSDRVRSWHDYGEEEDRVRQAIIEELAELAHGPSTAWLARRTGLDEDRVTALVDRLESRDLVVRDSESNAIVGVYPLTTRSTDHRVGSGGRIVQAMCAIDAHRRHVRLGRRYRVSLPCVQRSCPGGYNGPRQCARSPGARLDGRLVRYSIRGGVRGDLALYRDRLLLLRGSPGRVARDEPFRRRRIPAHSRRGDASWTGAVLASAQTGDQAVRRTA